jgi:hypothetical protein
MYWRNRNPAGDLRDLRSKKRATWAILTWFGMLNNPGRGWSNERITRVFDNMKTIRSVAVAALLTMPQVAGFAQAPAAPVPVGGIPVAPMPSAPVSVSPATAEVIRLAESSVSDDVILAYIQNSQATFNLNADQVVYLKDVGLSPAVVTAMLLRDNALRAQQAQNPNLANQPVYPPTNPSTPTSVPTDIYAPTQTVPQQTEDAAAPVYVTNPPQEVSYFYSDLSPYGTWVQLGGVGWCWQPHVACINHGWRPYCHGGHWLCTDAGWYWQSDYSWGWAPFHYGRWQLHDHCGWVWVPGYAWAPAWVTWRTGGDYCGWAPLPPHSDFDAHLGYRYNGVSVSAGFDFGLGVGCFSFVATKDFCEHDLARHHVAPAQVQAVYHNTTVVNNYTVNNNTIVNQGVPVANVAAATKREIRPATIREVPASVSASRALRSPIADHGSTVVYRQPLAAPARAVSMVAQKVDEKHPVIRPTPLVAMKSPGAATLDINRPGATSAPGGNQPAGLIGPPTLWRSKDLGLRPTTAPGALPGTPTAPGRSPTSSGVQQAQPARVYTQRSTHQAADLRFSPQSAQLAQPAQPAQAAQPVSQSGTTPR